MIGKKGDRATNKQPMEQKQLDTSTEMFEMFEDVLTSQLEHVSYWQMERHSNQVI